ncbi:hypothetical protein CHS0354_017922 [Potamilus streckersoni]|uniref:Uncharacterized protein n=1 Tax=Potamilus streckersoni TaxID=2493646 RepID=A0AAE0VKY6_9BIVA|nr:hypothetical protein CHS0354_017922 [Potamilus streckersoni]
MMTHMSQGEAQNFVQLNAPLKAGEQGTPKEKATTTVKKKREDKTLNDSKRHETKTDSDIDNEFESANEDEKQL